MELEQIAKEYAKNRESLRTVKKQISLLVDPKQTGNFEDHVEIDLSEFRDAVYEEDCRWEGWVDAVLNYSPKSGKWITEESPEYKLAELLDEKARLRSEAGQIKRNLYHAGNRLLKVKK